MKKLATIILGLAASLSLQNLSAATATTEPVGGLTITCQSASDTAVTLPLGRAAEFTGTVSGLSGSSFSSAYTAGSESYHVLLTSGAMEGMYYDVTTANGTTITVDPNGGSSIAAQGVANGDSYKVIPYWTLNTLMPSGAGIHASPDVFNPTSLFILTDNASAGVNLPVTTQYFYHNGAMGPAGWYINGNLGAGPQDSTTLPPDTYYIVRNPALGDTSITLSGSVAMHGYRTIISRNADSVPQDNYIGMTFPIDMTLAETNLQNAAGFEQSADVFNPSDLLILFDNISSGTNKPLSTQYFYHNGAMGPAGWYINGNLGAGPQDAVAGIIKAGQGFVIRKSANGLAVSGDWNAPAPY